MVGEKARGHTWASCFHPRRPARHPKRSPREITAKRLGTAFGMTLGHTGGHCKRLLSSIKGDVGGLFTGTRKEEPVTLRLSPRDRNPLPSF